MFCLIGMGSRKSGACRSSYQVGAAWLDDALVFGGAIYMPERHP